MLVEHPVQIEALVELVGCQQAVYGPGFSVVNSSSKGRTSSSIIGVTSLAFS
jgi:hypothetical protein